MTDPNTQAEELRAARDRIAELEQELRLLREQFQRKYIEAHMPPPTRPQRGPMPRPHDGRGF